jgi:hypothetical protein
MSSRRHPRSRRAAGIALIVAGALLMTTAGSMAVAQDPQPDSRPAAVAEADAGSQPGSPGDVSGLRSNLGQLPFTGLDLLILGGLAMLLLGTGMALRRLSAPRV